MPEHEESGYDASGEASSTQRTSEQRSSAPGSSVQVTPTQSKQQADPAKTSSATAAIAIPAPSRPTAHDQQRPKPDASPSSVDPGQPPRSLVRAAEALLAEEEGRRAGEQVAGTILHELAQPLPKNWLLPFKTKINQELEMGSGRSTAITDSITPSGATPWDPPRSTPMPVETGGGGGGRQKGEGKGGGEGEVGGRGGEGGGKGEGGKRKPPTGPPSPEIDMNDAPYSLLPPEKIPTPCGSFGDEPGEASGQAVKLKKEETDEGAGQAVSGKPSGSVRRVELFDKPVQASGPASEQASMDRPSPSPAGGRNGPPEGSRKPLLPTEASSPVLAAGSEEAAGGEQQTTSAGLEQPDDARTVLLAKKDIQSDNEDVPPLELGENLHG